MARSERGLLSLSKRHAAGATDEARRAGRTRTAEKEWRLREPLEGRSMCAPIPTTDGTELSAEVYEPQPEKTRGVIIFVHGFGGNKGENGLFHTLAGRCVEEGFAAVLYDWRGIAESGGDFPSSTLEDHKSDFERVVEWAKAEFATSLDSLHAVGFSLGAAVIGLSAQRRKLASVVYLSPASRPGKSMWPRYEELWGEIEADGVIEKPGSDVLLGRPILESLRDTDLGPEAFDLEVPLLVCHGTADTRIKYTYTEELLRSRSGSEFSFRHIKVDGASHSFRPADRCWDRLGDDLAEWFGEAAGRERPVPSHDGAR